MDLGRHPVKKRAKTPAHFLREDPKSHFPPRIRARSRIPAESSEVAQTSPICLALIPTIKPGERIIH